jgi:hypothetical protein
MTGTASEQRFGMLAAETIRTSKAITQVITCEPWITRAIGRRVGEPLRHQEVTADGEA